MSKIKFCIAEWNEKLKKGANINEPDATGKTALIQAILADNVKAVEFCIMHGADVKLNSEPIFIAADYSKKPEIIEMLVKNGADIEANSKDGMTPLMYAVLDIKKDNYAVVKKMIDLGANVNAKDDRGFSVLFTSLAAVAKHNQEKIKLLIQSGADVNATDNDNETPLFWANWCDADVIRTFVNAGADVNAKNNNGENAFTRIIQYDVKPDVFKILIDAKADVNARDNNGRTPLFYVARQTKNPQTIKALIKHGADINARDNTGKIALSYAQENSVGQKILMQYIRKQVKSVSMKGKKVVFDTETTGFNLENNHKLIEIGAFELDENNQFTGKTFHHYINPKREIPEEITAINGLTQEFLQDYPTFAEIQADFLKFIDGKTLIAHNLPFDLGFLEKELGVNLPNKMIDTLVLAKMLFPKNKNHLDELCLKFAIDYSDVPYSGTLLNAHCLACVYQNLINILTSKKG